jgi:hypothetical protein
VGRTLAASERRNRRLVLVSQPDIKRLTVRAPNGTIKEARSVLPHLAQSQDQRKTTKAPGPCAQLVPIYDLSLSLILSPFSDAPAGGNAAALGGGVGIVNQKRLPWPISLSTPMAPPWAVTANLQKVNPSP